MLQNILPEFNKQITCCLWHDYAQLFPAFPSVVIVCVVTTSPSSHSAITKYLRGNKPVFFEAGTLRTPQQRWLEADCLLSHQGLVTQHLVTEQEQRGVPVQQQCKRSSKAG